MVQVVVHTPDVVGERMAGPGIRASHLAEELAKHFDVTWIAKVQSGEMVRSAERGGLSADSIALRPPSSALRPPPSALRTTLHGSPEARTALRKADVLIGQPARGFRVRRPHQKIIYDLFDPTVLELRELYGNTPSLRQRIHLAAEWWRLSEALMRADLLICAARKQRRLYETLQSGSAPWIEVPFGIDPADVKSCPKPQDDIVVWGGGVWE